MQLEFRRVTRQCALGRKGGDGRITRGIFEINAGLMWECKMN